MKYRRKLILNLAMTIIMLMVSFLMGSGAIMRMISEAHYKGYNMFKLIVMIGFFLYAVWELTGDIEKINKYWNKNE